MEDLGEALRLFVPAGFGQAGDFQRIRDWLATGAYTPVGEVSDKLFELRPHDANDVLGTFTEEFCATALSCIESMIEAERGARVAKALAWPSIQAYYSAFFAAHSFLRFFGVACAWLIKDDFVQLRAVAAVHGVLTSSPVKGQWQVEMTASGTLVFRCGSGGGGGSHDMVWATFTKVVDDICGRIASSNLIVDVDKVEATATLQSLRDVANNGVPSNIRNAVNYRREYGVWFPYSGFQKKLDGDMARIAKWRTLSSMSYRNGASAVGLSGMLGFSTAMGSVCISLVQVGEKYFDGSKRMASGPLKLLKLQGHR